MRWGNEVRSVVVLTSHVSLHTRVQGLGELANDGLQESTVSIPRVQRKQQSSERAEDQLMPEGPGVERVVVKGKEGKGRRCKRTICHL